MQPEWVAFFIGKMHILVAFFVEKMYTNDIIIVLSEDYNPFNTLGLDEYCVEVTGQFFKCKGKV